MLQLIASVNASKSQLIINSSTTALLMGKIVTEKSKIPIFESTETHVTGLEMNSKFFTIM